MSLYEGLYFGISLPPRPKMTFSLLSQCTDFCSQCSLLGPIATRPFRMHFPFFSSHKVSFQFVLSV
jgi:hypothetical protein